MVVQRDCVHIVLNFLSTLGQAIPGYQSLEKVIKVWKRLLLIRSLFAVRQTGMSVLLTVDFHSRSIRTQRQTQTC